MRDSTTRRVWLGSGSTAVPNIEVRVVVENALSILPEQLPKLFELVHGTACPPEIALRGGGALHHSRDRHGARREERTMSIRQNDVCRFTVSLPRGERTKRSNDAEFEFSPET